MLRKFGLPRIAISAIAVFVFGLTASAVRADQVFLVNSTIAGTGQVSAQATFHQVGGNLLAVSLQNLGTTSNVGQGISGIQFQICDSQGHLLNVTGSITAQDNPLIQVAGDGTSTSLGTQATGWGLISNGQNLTLTGLGFTGNGTNPPDELILGTMSGLNGSIAGNDPHNPFIYQTGVFSLTLGQNLPQGFQICNVVLLFGTGPNSVNATVPTPEPASMLLLGTGLAGVAASIRRRRAQKKQ
jgi:hypothetical protein